jgi:Bacterial Ig-like domain
MNFKSFVFSLAIIGLLLISLISSPGCASIIPPSGGPKDSLPPILVKADPPDSTKGFKDKTINFTFDEYVELQSVQENLLISPTPVIFPVIESKLKTITIKIKDTLEANTTYVYNFGKAIKDVNEGNVFKDFSYIFTTGNYIDSLELKGKVILAETGGVDSTLIVMLHKTGVDSALVKENPRYISKLDSLGNFHFRFLPPGKFYIYAMKDEGGSHRYFNKTQLFAFADEALDLTIANTPVTLYAFADKKETTEKASAATTRRNASEADERRLRYTTNLVNNLQQDLLTSFTMNFEQALAKFDSSKMQFSTDTLFTPEKNYSLELDSLRKKITVNIKWIEATRYNIILDKEFAEDSSGRKLLKTDTLKFVTKRLKDYGTVKFNFSNLDTAVNQVLLIYQGGKIIRSYPLTSASIYESIFPPGEYDLRLLYDKNKNGNWDSGDFWEGRKQPELVKPIAKKITIKANWDNEFEIAL